MRSETGIPYNRLERVQRFVFEYLLSHPCVDCQQKNPIVLEFYHLPDQKFPVVDEIDIAIPLDVLENNLNQCIVRCENCNRIKMHKGESWYRVDLLVQLELVI